MHPKQTETKTKVLALSCCSFVIVCFLLFLFWMFFLQTEKHDNEQNAGSKKHDNKCDSSNNISNSRKTGSLRTIEQLFALKLYKIAVLRENTNRIALKSKSTTLTTTTTTTTATATMTTTATTRTTTKTTTTTTTTTMTMTTTTTTTTL